MPLHKLAHVAIRTNALEITKDFYCRVLGFREGFRPAFPFPGAWLYLDGERPDDAVLHLIGIDRADPSGLNDYLGEQGEDALVGGGAVDHVAFAASDLHSMRERLRAMGVTYRERVVPTLELHQLFIEDPSGITIELNFACSQ